VADVVIIDDDVDLALTVRDVLELGGHTVRTAFNGAEGLAAITARHPDVILLDVEMPVLDGPSMAYELLVTNAGKELIPIVLSSGYAEIDAIADRIGTPYTIRKPCSIAALTEVLDRACRERRPPRPAGAPQLRRAAS
jgi:CheY-like chemotaxis protein